MISEYCDSGPLKIMEQRLWLAFFISILNRGGGMKNTLQDTLKYPIESFNTPTRLLPDIFCVMLHLNPTDIHYHSLLLKTPLGNWWGRPLQTKKKYFLSYTNLGNMFIFSLLSDIMLCAYIKMKSKKIPTHIKLLKTNKEANCELMQHEVGAASVGRDWSRIQPWPPREI